MRYRDSAADGPGQSLEQWLLAELGDAEIFAAQVGYLTSQGFQVIAPHLKRLLDGGGEAHLVTGAREGQVTRADLTPVVRLFGPYRDRASLTLADDGQALMHAKSYYLRRLDGTETVLCGSANLTLGGLRDNHEAAITLDTRDEPAAPCAAVLQAIRGWADSGRPARQVTEGTLEQLIIAPAPRTREATARGVGTPKPPPSEALAHLLNSTLEKLEAVAGGEAVAVGIPTGFADLDELTGGLRPGQLVVIGARPALGKTTLCLDITRSAAIRHGKPAAFFSLEMRRIELTEKILAAEARVSLQNMRTGRPSDDDWQRLARRMGEIAEAPLYINDWPYLTVRELRAEATRLKREADIQLVVVDYLQLLTPVVRLDNRVQEVSEMSRGLKALAMELQVPVVVASQLNRMPEQRTDKKPQLSDLRDSGQIEQDADIVILLYREDAVFYESARAGEADFMVVKYRNGPTGIVTVAFQGHYSRFIDMA